MKKTMRFIGFALCAILLFCAVPAPAQTVYGYCTVVYRDKDTFAQLESYQVAVTSRSGVLRFPENCQNGAYVLSNPTSATIAVDETGQITPAAVTVFYQKAGTTVSVQYMLFDGTLLETQEIQLSAGSHTIYPALSENSALYALQGPQSARVTVSSSGVASPAAVTFLYDYAREEDGATVWVYYFTTQGQILDTEQRTLPAGTHTVMPQKTFDGYALTGTASYPVTVDDTLTPSRNAVIFYYAGGASAVTVPPVVQTPVPTRVPTPVPTAVPTAVPATPVPVSGIGTVPYSVSGNQKAQGNVARLADNNISTAYEYIIYQSEFNEDRGHMELTFTFSPSQIGAVWMRAGDCASRELYNRYSAPRQIKVYIEMADGGQVVENFTLQDGFDVSTSRSDRVGGYQRMLLSRVYTDVVKIEMDILHVYTHDSEYRNYVHISDILFTSGDSLQ